jgi:hypothetical protein
MRHVTRSLEHSARAGVESFRNVYNIVTITQSVIRIRRTADCPNHYMSCRNNADTDQDFPRSPLSMPIPLQRNEAAGVLTNLIKLNS